MVKIRAPAACNTWAYTKVCALWSHGDTANLIWHPHPTHHSRSSWNSNRMMVFVLRICRKRPSLKAVASHTMTSVIVRRGGITKKIYHWLTALVFWFLQTRGFRALCQPACKLCKTNHHSCHFVTEPTICRPRLEPWSSYDVDELLFWASDLIPLIRSWFMRKMNRRHVIWKERK